MLTSRFFIFKHMAKSQRNRKRKAPGTGGKGRFYRVEINPKKRFSSFRTQDVGKPGSLERVAGRRKNGDWDTAAWLVEKGSAHVDGNRLVVDEPQAKSLLKQVREPITREKGDVFSAKPRKRKVKKPGEKIIKKSKKE